MMKGVPLESIECKDRHCCNLCFSVNVRGAEVTGVTHSASHLCQDINSEVRSRRLLLWNFSNRLSSVEVRWGEVVMVGGKGATGATGASSLSPGETPLSRPRRLSAPCGPQPAAKSAPASPAHRPSSPRASSDITQRMSSDAWVCPNDRQLALRAK